jgi:hypothetical protein
VDAAKENVTVIALQLFDDNLTVKVLVSQDEESANEESDMESEVPSGSSRREVVHACMQGQEAETG